MYLSETSGEALDASGCDRLVSRLSGAVAEMRSIHFVERFSSTSIRDTSRVLGMILLALPWAVSAGAEVAQRVHAGSATAGAAALAGAAAGAADVVHESTGLQSAVAEPNAAVKAAGTAPARFPIDLRGYDGRDNNAQNPNWGKVGAAFRRVVAADYEDGRSSPAGANRPSPRQISNLVVAQPRSLPNRAGVSSMVWQWGQFLDHDLDLTLAASPAEPFPIAVPAGDRWFDPSSAGTATIALDRSAHRDVAGVRQQTNALTSYIDASMVYGVDAVRAAGLRRLDGSGRLATSAGNLLPFNTGGLFNLPAGPGFFVAGDVRVNEQVGLMAIQTLFVREHNFWADRIRLDQPQLDDDAVYQQARALVAAEIQAVTYREFLPVLLGPNALPPYRGYDPRLDASVSNEFATAAYRVGHTMLPPELLRLDGRYRPLPGGALSLAASFFNLAEVTANGIEPLLRGLVRQPAQEVDVHVVDEVRNFLFGAPGSPGFDLASLNLQRGRDHGLASYNDTRAAIGLPRVSSFAEISSDPRVAEALAAAYLTVDDVDLWIGGLAERRRPGALVGETFQRLLVDQFRRLRDGDRFWYQSYLPPAARTNVEQATLARIIQRNTGINGLQANVFRLPGR